MKVNFIGHGLNSDEKYNVGKVLVESFNDVRFNDFKALVAFASSGATKIILPHIKNNRSRFKKIIFYIGIDQHGTSQEALSLLLDNQIKTFIYHTKSSQIFHPKIYLFEGEKWCRIIVGSTNFTQGGLFLNIESSVQFDFKSNDSQGRKILNQINEYYYSLISEVDNNLELLTKRLLKLLCKHNLLCSEKDLNRVSKKSIISELEIFPRKKNLVINRDGILKADPVQDAKSPRYKNFTEKDSEQFEYFFERWRKYKTDNPKSAGIVHRDTKDRELYTWYRKLKDLSSAGIEIPSEHLRLLNDAQFPFKDGKEVKRLMIWNERFNELVLYKEKFRLQYTHVPQQKSPGLYASLGSWCAIQKQRRKGLLTPKWTQYEEEKLNSINFVWEPPATGGKIGGDDELWLENYFKLEKFTIAFGHANPSQVDENPEVRKLAKWINTQRTLKSIGKKEKTHRRFLHPNRESLLIELGVDFEWELNKTKIELENFITSYLEFKHFYPDEKIEKGDKRFSKMLQKRAQIRYRYKNDKSLANKWRIDRLNEIGFTWE